MNDPLRLLLVAPLPPPAGGIATWTQNLTGKIEDDPETRMKHVDTAIRWKKTVNLSLALRLAGGSIQALRDIALVAVALLTFRPHVLHLASTARLSSARDAILMLLSRICRVPGLLHYHRSFSQYESRGGVRLAVALCAMRFARSIVVLDGNTHRFLSRRIPPDKLCRIPNMIDLEEIEALAPLRQVKEPKAPKRDQVELVFAGMVIPGKGVVEQVKACVKLGGVQLHMIGEYDPRYRRQLEKLASQRDSGSWLHFHGHRTRGEVLRRMVLGDIVLLPSHDEGFPNAVLEAMALQKPVVVSRVGALPEMIDADGENPCGFCVAPGDAESLRIALDDLIKRPERWPAMGRAGRSRVEALYSAGPVMEQLFEQWDRLRHLSS